MWAWARCEVAPTSEERLDRDDIVRAIVTEKTYELKND